MKTHTHTSDSPPATNTGDGSESATDACNAPSSSTAARAPIRKATNAARSGGVRSRDGCDEVDGALRGLLLLSEPLSAAVADDAVLMLHRSAAATSSSCMVQPAAMPAAVQEQR